MTHAAQGSGTEQTTGRRGRGRPRNPATDHRITAAAAELMLHRGFDKMTVDDVAAKAGVGKATVYRRWPSKEELAVAAMAQIYSAELPDPDTGSIHGDLVENFTNVLAFVNSPEGEAYFRMSMAESIRDPRIAALYRASTERAEATAARMYERAIERGEVRADIDVSIVVQWLGGLIGARAITHRPLPQVQDVETLVAFTLRGILADR
ncbi:MAG TPA: TetR/AcrR family transcriptional regulator [Nocardioidaceae bacterium]|nr:TetR/AcrR family transcriptional regulator [Nocardioidaceae bacterium]